MIWAVAVFVYFFFFFFGGGDGRNLVSFYSGLLCSILEFSLNGAELSLYSVNSENLRNY